MAVQQSAVLVGDPVPGEGPHDARLMLVGEQPGDQEDRAGRPFVGPAGRLLDRSLEQVGLERGDVYLTNVVKRFHYKLRGKRRIHEKPSRADIAGDLPLLMDEIGEVSPEAVVLLGATAAQAVLGPRVRIGRDRGRPLESELAPLVLVTAHPAAALRVPDRRRAEGEIVRDLQEVGAWLASHPGRHRPCG